MITTEDGVKVGVGDRVYAYYYGPGDQAWATITEIDDQGWATLIMDDGKQGSADGSRLASYQPAWCRQTRTIGHD